MGGQISAAIDEGWWLTFSQAMLEYDRYLERLSDQFSIYTTEISRLENLDDSVSDSSARFESTFRILLDNELTSLVNAYPLVENAIDAHKRKSRKAAKIAKDLLLVAALAVEINNRLVGMLIIQQTKAQAITIGRILSNYSWIQQEIKGYAEIVHKTAISGKWSPLRYNARFSKDDDIPNLKAKLTTIYSEINSEFHL